MVSAVFTGIVEEIGRIAAVEQREGATRLAIECETALDGTRIGDSIAVNGVCLTVVALDESRFDVEAVPETLRRTNIGALSEGSPVNLERAAQASRFMGGHYVQGHVDATGEITAIEPDGEARNYRFRIPGELARYVVPKGYVCLDGASLTVVDAGEDWLTVTLVPHTQKSVVMGSVAPGYVVNLEVDVLAKYVERIAGERIGALEARIARLERENGAT
jgi:riboflavin synthase